MAVRGGRHYLYRAVDRHGKSVASLLCRDRTMDPGSQSRRGHDFQRRAQGRFPSLGRPRRVYEIYAGVLRVMVGRTLRCELLSRSIAGRHLQAGCFVGRLDGKMSQAPQENLRLQLVASTGNN
ncbi:MAG: hypothetical protein HC872_09410 [Gammaproteobacteria bacterium]|nr:hypothetical protein [Gammaproteobacteria bacterium]